MITERFIYYSWFRLTVAGLLRAAFCTVFRQFDLIYDMVHQINGCNVIVAVLRMKTQ